MWLSPCVNVKLIHVELSDWKMSIPPDLNTGIHDNKTEPIAAQLAILAPLHQSFRTEFIIMQISVE